MPENRKDPADPAADSVLGALVQATAGARVRRPTQGSGAADEARAAYLSAVRRRERTRAHWRQLRPRKLLAFIVGALLALGLGGSSYFFLDLPEVTDPSPYQQVCQIDGTLMMRPPIGDSWIRLSGEAPLAAGAVVVTPAGDTVRITFGRGGLVLDCHPGSRLLIRKGRRTPVEVLSGEVTCELRAGEDETLVGLPREREVAFTRGQTRAEAYRLVLAEQGARATLLVDEIQGRRVGQVRVERGSVDIRQGAHVRRRGLATGVCALCSPSAVQVWTPEELGARGWPRGDGFAGAHWRVRPAGFVRRTPELSSALPLGDLSPDTIGDLRRLATAAGGTLDQKRAAITSLGLLDSPDSLAALLAMVDAPSGELPAELQDSHLRALLRFSDRASEGRVQLALQQRSDPQDPAEGLLARAEGAFVLGRRGRHLQTIRAQLAALRTGAEADSAARVWCLAAAGFANAEGGSGPAVSELQAISIADESSESVSEGTQLAAIAALEELAAFLGGISPGANAAIESLLVALTEAEPRIALAAEAALVGVTGKSIAAPSGGQRGLAGRASAWREALAAPK